MSDQKETAAMVPQQQTALLRPVASPDEMIGHHQVLTDLIQKALQPERDFGVIPGTKRPTLLKPGAERMCVAFGCVARYELLEQEVDHSREVTWVKQKWEGGQGNRRKVNKAGKSLGLYRYVTRCDLISRATGDAVGSGIGSCSTMESKYIDRPRDCENTVLKMAQKRALVAAVLNAFGLSDRFTQDLDDDPGAAGTSRGQQGAGKGNSRAKAGSKPKAGSLATKEQKAALEAEIEAGWMGKKQVEWARHIAHDPDLTAKAAEKVLGQIQAMTNRPVEAAPQEPEPCGNCGATDCAGECAESNPEPPPPEDGDREPGQEG